MVEFNNQAILYKGLEKIAQKIHPLWITSLNHDLLIEMIAARYDIPLNEGLGGKY